MTITTGANFVPEVWSKEMQRAAEKNLVAARLVKRFDQEVMHAGDTIHVPIVSNLTVTAKSANTAVTFQAPTEDKVDISISSSYESSILIEDDLSIQSAYRLAEEYKEKESYALAKKIDTDVLALYSNITQTVGTAGNALTDINILRGIQYLDDADAPAQDRAFIMKPSVKASLLAIDKYVNQDFTGMGDIPVKTGLFGQRYGLLFYVSSNVPVDGNSYPINMIIHKEAFALAVQQNITIKSDYILEYCGQGYVAKVLYGVASYRSTFGCLLYSA